MPSIEQNGCTFAGLMERTSFWAGLVAFVVVTVAGLVLFGLAEPPTQGGLSMTIPWGYVPGIVAFLVLMVMYYYWTLNYATQKRLELLGVRNLEALLDQLSEYLTEGNDGILNAPVISDQELGAWLEKKKA